MNDKTQAVPDFTKDPHWGKGGRYVINPATGQREPAPPVEEEVANVPGFDKSIAQNGPGPTVRPSTQVDSMALQSSKQAAEADPSMLRKEKHRA